VEVVWEPAQSCGRVPAGANPHTAHRNDLKPGLNDRRLIEKYTNMRHPSPNPDPNPDGGGVEAWRRAGQVRTRTVVGACLLLEWLYLALTWASSGSPSHQTG